MQCTGQFPGFQTLSFIALTLYPAAAAHSASKNGLAVSESCFYGFYPGINAEKGQEPTSLSLIMAQFTGVTF